MDDAADKSQTIGIWMTTALVVGTIIGSGIFMLPISLAPFGINALIGWLVSGFGVLCIGFAMARISRFTSGGLAGQISSIRVNPINIAREKTSGIDIAFRGSIPTSITASSNIPETRSLRNWLSIAAIISHVTNRPEA